MLTSPTDAQGCMGEQAPKAPTSLASRQAKVLTNCYAKGGSGFEVSPRGYISVAQSIERIFKRSSIVIENYLS